MDIGTNDLLTDLLVLVTFMYTEEKKKCFRHIDPVLYGLQCIYRNYNYVHVVFKTTLTLYINYICNTKFSIQLKSWEFYFSALWGLYMQKSKPGLFPLTL